MAKDTYYFNGVGYSPPGGRGPGRPPDLDFIANILERQVFIGIQVKNQERYPRPDDINMFLDIAQTLKVKPLLIARMAHEMQFKRIIDVGGKFVIFKQLLLQPPFPNKELRETRGFLIAVYARVPGFSVNRLVGIKQSF